MTTILRTHRTINMSTGPMPEDFLGEVRIINIALTSPELNTVLEEVRQRIVDGEATPVLASHVDALGLRAIIQQLAEETDY